MDHSKRKEQGEGFLISQGMNTGTTLKRKHCQNTY